MTVWGYGPFSLSIKSTVTQRSSSLLLMTITDLRIVKLASRTIICHNCTDSYSKKKCVQHAIARAQLFFVQGRLPRKIPGPHLRRKVLERCWRESEGFWASKMLFFGHQTQGQGKTQIDFGDSEGIKAVVSECFWWSSFYFPCKPVLGMRFTDHWNDLFKGWGLCCSLAGLSLNLCPKDSWAIENITHSKDGHV